MIRKLLRALPLAALAALPVGAQIKVGDIPVDQEKMPGWRPLVNPDYSLMPPKQSRGDAVLPVRVNNADNKHFPAVFSQDGGSCTAASEIGYIFTYELNSYRNTEASQNQNIMPTHFSWLQYFNNWLNCSGNAATTNGIIAINNGIPNMTVYGGRTYSNLFGNNADWKSDDGGWMQGYNRWYNAMANRAKSVVTFPLTVETEEGRRAVKHWLWNHNGDKDFDGGGICGIVLAITGSTTQSIPNTTANSEAGVVGKSYIVDWGPQVDHAMTIVGYDDAIEFDLDGNGTPGEKEKDEVGAWIVANSWGAWWGNNGFIYCPYKNAVAWKGSTNYYSPIVYHVRKDYSPQRTIKVKMNYSHRSEICLSAGISTDLNATQPEKSINFEMFDYAGDWSDKDSKDAAVPMLGRWANGKLNDDPMEMGYDLTDLTAHFNARQPLKYFFTIQSKGEAAGTGKLHSCSILDYEFDAEGIEIPFDIASEGMEIKNQGGTTTISVIVAGEPLNPPLNPTIVDDVLSWDAPEVSGYKLLGYNVYSGDEVVYSTDSDTRSYSGVEKSKSYRITARYEMQEKVFESAKSEAPAQPYYGKKVGIFNRVRKFTNSGLKINGLFDKQLTTATVEYWIKPASCTDYNQQMGPGWAQNWMSHTTRNGEFVVGWSTADRITTPANTLSAGKWTHVAYTIEGGELKVYVNGNLSGTINTNHGGIGGFGDFCLGLEGSNGLSANLDEVRIWSTVRSRQDIQGTMYAEIADPANTPGLLVELKMDEAQGVAPVDATGQYVVEMLGNAQSRLDDNSLLKDKRKLYAQFALANVTGTTGCGVKTTNQSSGNAIAFDWVTSEDKEKHYTSYEPTFIFSTPGEKVITLVAKDPAGVADTVSQTIRIEALAAPQPSFTVPSLVTVSNRVSFINTTATPGCSYEWTINGGDVEKAYTTNVAARFATPGTYTVTLRATNAAGSATATKEIHVSDIQPIADFNIATPIVLKGNTVQINDASKNTPESWYWEVEDRAHHFVANTKNISFTFNDPGIYSLSLDVANGSGSSKIESESAIVVCNADAVTGLNFTADDKVDFANPINLERDNAFTIDYWIFPKTSPSSSANQVGGSMRNFLIRTRNDGTVILNIGGKSYYSATGLVTPLTWHHIAVTFDNGHLSLFVDGKLSGSFETPFVSGQYPAFPERIALGGSFAPMLAILDEFRIWNRALTLNDILDKANQPIENVAEAEKEGLVLYYQFNQTGGDVQDATSGVRHGVRTGFGAEGDAWSKSLGAFCLSAVKRENVTAQHLTNYEKPFLHNEEIQNASFDNYLGLLTNSENSTWVLENATINNDVVTGFCVDTENESRLVLPLGETGFASSVVNHKLYQNVELTEGYYVFGVESPTLSQEMESYLVVGKGNSFPDKNGLSDAMASARLGEGEVSFMLLRPATISLGLLLNSSASTPYVFDRFYLEKKFTNDDFTWTGVDGTTTSSKVNVRTLPGEVVITAERPTLVKIYSIAGVAVYSNQISGSVHVKLPAGMYIINGAKYIVR